MGFSIHGGSPLAGWFIDESLEVKLPTTDGKAEVGRVREEERREEERRGEKRNEDQRRERVGGKKMQVREKLTKGRHTVFFR
jgi:hypothetical protein